jgi:hypothetical protein
MKKLAFIAVALLIPALSILGEPTIGQSYRINFTDVDGNAFSTADGHITTVVLTSKANIDKARLVGDRSPDFCLGNPAFRMITVLAFEEKHSKPIRLLMSAIMRRRRDAEGRRLQARYDKLKIARDARRDVFCVPDFDGALTSQLGSQFSPDLFRVFAFGKNGELIKQWTDVPSADELTAVLK